MRAGCSASASKPIAGACDAQGSETPPAANQTTTGDSCKNAKQMGLDMYLSKKHYIGAEYEHRKVKCECKITIDGKEAKIDYSKIVYIEERAAYWRKANHIHQWFVDNVQDGVDDCREYEVSEEKLRGLLSDCKKALLNRGAAGDILPTQEGFFFGSTEIDEYYFEQCQRTAEIIENILKDTTERGYLPYDVIYSSSW